MSQPVIDGALERQFAQLSIDEFLYEGVRYSRESWREKIRADAEAGMLMGTLDLIDAARGWYGGISDYRLAQVLGITKSAVSRWRVGKARLSDRQAIEIARILELDALYVLNIVWAERTDSSYVRELLDAALERARRTKNVLSKGAAAGVAVLMILASSGAHPAPQNETKASAPSVYYDKPKGKKKAIRRGHIGDRSPRRAHRPHRLPSQKPLFPTAPTVTA